MLSSSDPMDAGYKAIYQLLADIRIFSVELSRFIIKTLRLSFIRFEIGKGVFVTTLYKRRGKMAKRFMHSGVAAITALGALIAPVVAEEFPGRGVDPWSIPTTSAVLSAESQDPETATIISEKDYRGEVITYTVSQGDTVSTIAEKFGVSEDTIRWENDLKSKDAIKVGQELQILPVTGISHKVQKGDTVYSIAKKYDTSPQAIVNYPFNTFTNDETFELAIGQSIIVPDGVMPTQVLWSPVARVRQITPDAGTVTASGSFVWPAGGTISQYYVWYHQAIDIANKSLPPVLAADAGRVITAGWHAYGYGNHVVIDHGNGYKTLYAHMNKIYVVVGQSVNRGDAIGQLGSTGRSTGPHLHFEVYQNGIRINPLSVLR